MTASTGARQVLLDTSVVINPPTDGFRDLADSVAISAISVAELQYGVEASVDPVERQRRRRRLQVVVEAMEVIAFDERTAESYGVLANLVRAGGRDPRPRRLDLLVAATAERHGLALATRNARDFRHLERVLEVIEVR
jgi:toxin FitB